MISGNNRLNISKPPGRSYTRKYANCRQNSSYHYVGFSMRIEQLSLSGSFSLSPLVQDLIEPFYSVYTWWQIGVIVTGALFALWVGGRLQNWFQPAIQPGAATGYRRTAMRTGALATIPLILWLWLVVGSAILRHWQKIPTEFLHYAILLAGALTLIRMGVFVLRHSFSPGSRLKAWEGVLTFTIWSIVALHILGWLPLVKEVLDEYAVRFGNVRVSLLTISSFLLSVALLLVLALWIANAFHARVMRSQSLDLSMKIALTKLSKFLLLLLAVAVALFTAGIDLTVLTVFGGALGVGLGLGLQRIVSNFISGFIIIFEESIHPGDVIGLANNTFGVVQSLNARYVVVRNGDGLDVLIPNEELVTAQITNWSYRGDRNIRLRLPLPISYGDNLERALTIIERVACSHERVLKNPKPMAYLLGYGDNSINLELGVWINNPERGISELRSDLYLGIWKEFSSAGITLSAPRSIILQEAPAQGLFRSADK